MPQIVRNSSICQPFIDFVDGCKTETSNLFAKLPKKDEDTSRLLNIVRRIVFVCSIVLPLIGLLAILCSECCKTEAPRQAVPNSAPQVPPSSQAATAAVRPPAAPAVETKPTVPKKVPAQTRIVNTAQLQETLLLLSTIEPNNLQDPGAMSNYLELKQKIETIDSTKLNKNKSLYDKAIQHIRILDAAAEVLAAN